MHKCLDCNVFDLGFEAVLNPELKYFKPQLFVYLRLTYVKYRREIKKKNIYIGRT